MKKRLLTVLLAVCMAVAMLPMTALAADVISKVYINIDTPVLGEKPDYDAYTGSSPSVVSASVVDDIDWIGTFDENGCFKSGEKYTLEVVVTLNDDAKRFSTNLKTNENRGATFNQTPCHIASWSEDKIVLTQDFKEIGNVFRAYTVASTPSQTEEYKSLEMPADLNGISVEEWNVLALTNIERAKEGKSLLVTFDKMQYCAGVRSDELKTKYSHTRPDDRSCFTVLKDNSFSTSAAGENIALNSDTAAVMRAWMNSEGHRANILSNNYRYMGVGKTDNGWVQLFANSSGSDCESMTYNEEGKYFTLKLKNGITAYAPYHPDSSPVVNGKVTFDYPGAYIASDKPDEPYVSSGQEELKDGWYNISTLGKYMNMTTDTVVIYAELRNKDVNDVFYIENQGNNQFTLQTKDMKYLYVDNFLNGRALIKRDSEYVWSYYKESGDNVFSFRPSQKVSMVMNAEGGQNADGTKIIIWTQSGFDAPSHAEFKFTPAAKPTNVVKHSFTDVPLGCYYEDAVVWAVDKEVTTGMTATTFNPSGNLTRGQVVAFLWRASGSPEPVSSTNPFTDVKTTDYFYKAVLWAVENGITTGVTATTFSPNATCTHGHALTFLYRALDGEAEKSGATYEKYAGQFYAESASWANDNGLVDAMDSKFDPKARASRAETIYYLYKGVGN